MKRREGLLAGAVLGLGLRPAAATPIDVQVALRQLAGSTPVKPGRVRLELPALVENGNAVPLTVHVESPMTADDHVRAIHVFVEKNPQPHVASFHLGPRCGRASVSTRIRLADTQTVMAACEMSDGSWWSGAAEAVVTLVACTEVE